MGIFIKTFILCFILTLGYLVYMFVGNESFTPNLELSDTNPIFSISKTKPYEDDLKPAEVETTIEEVPDTTIEDSAPAREVSKKHTHTCYFYSTGGKLIPIKREVEAPLTLENTIYLLLKGPLIAESKKGIYSEIPPNVDLINVQKKDDSIIVNLTSNFGIGGGSESIENRLSQLAKTVKSAQPGKKVYLYINGKEVEYLGGEGVYIKQPL